MLGNTALRNNYLTAHSNIVRTLCGTLTGDLPFRVGDAFFIPSDCIPILKVYIQFGFFANNSRVEGDIFDYIFIWVEHSYSPLEFNIVLLKQNPYLLPPQGLILISEDVFFFFQIRFLNSILFHPYQ